MAALGVVVVRQERLAVRAGCTRVEGPGFAQSLVGELDPRAPRVLAEDVGNGLPEGAGLFRFAGFGEEATDRVEHQFKLRRAEASNRDVARRPSKIGRASCRERV